MRVPGWLALLVMVAAGVAELWFIFNCIQP